MSKFKVIKQHDIKDCGAASLSMISNYYGLKLPIAKFRELIKVDNNGANFYGIIDGAKQIGLSAEALEGNPNEFLDGLRQNEFKCPLIAKVIIDNSLEHFVVIYEITNDKIIVADPSKGIVNYSFEDFFKIWTGHIITFETTEDFKKADECKGTFNKFFKLITRQYKLLTFVFFMSLFISTISILGTFVFQYIIDDVVTVSKVNTKYDVERTRYDSVASLNQFSTSSLKVNEIIEKKFDWLFLNLNRVCIAIIVLYLLRAILQMLRGRLLAKMSKNIDIPLMLGYYNHVVDLPISFFGTRKTGEIISRFSDASKIREAISSATFTLMLDTLMVIFCGVVLFIESHILFWITLGIIVVYAVVIVIFKNPIKDINQEIMEDNAQVVSYLKESIDGIETVKSLNGETFVKSKTQKKFVKFIDKNVKGSIIYILQDSIVTAVASIGVILLLWAGTSLVLNKVLTLGKLITFYSLLGFFLDPIKNLIELQPKLQTAVVAAERLNDILELSIEIESDNKKIQMETLKENIQFKNVDFRYGNRELVLKDINMSIQKGQRIALVGESGCGKTTLVKLLMNFYEIEKGEINIGNENVSDIDPQVLRKKIAYISQNVFLFSDSIKNNLLLGNENVEECKMMQACKASLADKFIMEMPLGYQTLLQENGSNLSGGQKQRLAIARALLKKPDILIMDEATSNLDTITEQSIKNTIDNLDSDKTCIIIAHRLSTIKNCDKIFVMDKGGIVESGTHEELMGKKGLYAKFVGENSDSK